MTTTTKPVHRSLAILKLSRSVPALISEAKAMVQAMTGNPNFPTPEPPLPTVTAGISALEVAQNAAQSRAHGAVVARDEKRTALVALLEQVRGYIQKTADTNYETSSSVIQSAGVNVRKQVVRPKRTFAIKEGAVSGTVKVTANVAARRASYDWQNSLDGGKTWNTMPSSLQASTTLTGLAPGSTVSFRYRAVTKAGVGDWSQPISILVK
jgi:hypothetical protein